MCGGGGWLDFVCVVCFMWCVVYVSGDGGGGVDVEKLFLWKCKWWVG